MYNSKSMKAEEFICHEEIEDTLAFADENRNNKEMIRQILDKARECKGLSHREASVLLACEDPEVLDEMEALAREIKKKFYGNSIVCSAVSLKLLCEWMCLLSVPSSERTYSEKETDSGRDPSGSDCPAGYGT